MLYQKEAARQGYLQKFMKTWDAKKMLNFSAYVPGVKHEDLPMVVTTTHMDDLGLSGPRTLINAIHAVVEERYGKCPLQEKEFKHIGHYYEVHKGASGFSIDTHLGPFIENLKMPDLKKFDKKALLGKAGMTEAKSYGGAFIWVVTCRLDVSGPVAIYHRSVRQTATGEVIFEAARIVEGLKENPRAGLRYLPLEGILRIALISDSSWKKLEEKYSQGALIIGVTANKCGEKRTAFGGRIHPLEGATKKSTRVSKSSWAAELLSAVRAEEKGSKLNSWLRELYCGFASASEECKRLEFEGAGKIEVDLYLDAQDLIDSITSEGPKISDSGMEIYVNCLREAWREGRISRIVKIATEDMVVDGMTKVCPKGQESRSDVGLMEFMTSGYWKPLTNTVIYCNGHIMNKYGCTSKWQASRTSTSKTDVHLVTMNMEPEKSYSVSYTSGSTLELFDESLTQPSSPVVPDELPAVRAVPVNAGVRRTLPMPLFMLGLFCLISVVHATERSTDSDTSSWHLVDLQNAVYGLSLSPREFGMTINRITLELEWKTLLVIVKWFVTLLCVVGSFFFGRSFATKKDAVTLNTVSSDSLGICIGCGGSETIPVGFDRVQCQHCGAPVFPETPVNTQTTQTDSTSNFGPEPVSDGQITYSANPMPTWFPQNDRPRVWIQAHHKGILCDNGLIAKVGFYATLEIFLSHSRMRFEEKVIF